MYQLLFIFLFRFIFLLYYIPGAGVVFFDTFLFAVDGIAGILLGRELQPTQRFVRQDGNIYHVRRDGDGRVIFNCGQPCRLWRLSERVKTPSKHQD